MQGLRRDFKRGVFWNGVSVGANMATHLLGMLVLGYFTVPEEFRLIGYLLVLMNLAFLLSEFGLATAIVQAEEVKPVQLNTIFTVNLLIGMAQTLIFCAVSPLAAWYFKAPELVPYMLTISLIFVTLSTGLVHKGKVARAVNFKAIALAETAGYAVYLTVLTVGAWRGDGVWAFVWAKLLEQLVETICMWWAGKFWPNVRDFSLHSIRAMFHFGLNMTGAQVVAFFIGNLDVFLVGRLLSKEAAGIYIYARQIVVVPAVRMLRLLTRVSVPVLSRMQNNLPRMARSFCLVNKLLLIISFPAFLGLAAVSSELFHAMLPDKWYAAIPLVRVLALGSSFTLLASLTMVVFYSLARANILMRMQLLVLVIRAVLFTALLYFSRNVLYLCWAILLERLVFTVTFQKKALEQMKAPLRMMLPYMRTPVAASGAMLAAVLPMSYFGSRWCEVRMDWVILLVIEVGSGAIIYGAVSLLMDHEIVTEVKSFFGGRKAPLPEANPAEGC